MKATRKTLAERLQSRLVLTADGCLEYSRARSRSGYGVIGVSADRVEYAHRVAWRLSNGEIPEGMFVCHRCDNPPCCNVDHLFLGSCADNQRDMARKGRSPARQRTHCQRGHPFDEANTYWDRKGYRNCRACTRTAQRKKN